MGGFSIDMPSEEELLAQWEESKKSSPSSISEEALLAQWEAANQSPQPTKPPVSLVSPEGWGYDIFSGPLRGATKTTAFIGDALAYPFRKGIEYLSGKEVPTMSEQAEKDLQRLGLKDTGSVLQKATEYALPISRVGAGLQVASGVGAAIGEKGAEYLDPESEVKPIIGGLVGGLSPSVLTSGAKSIFRAISPKTQAKTQAASIAKEVQKVIPEAFTPHKGETARKAAGELFKDIPSENVYLDDAIENITDFVEEVGGPLDPKSNTGKLIEYLKTRKPPTKVVSTPAGAIIDEATGKPFIAATEKVIEGGPAKEDLKEIQKFLANVNTQFGRQGEFKVNDVILKKVKDEVLGAVQKSVSPEAFTSFQGARTSYAKAKDVIRKEKLLERLFRRTPVGWDTFVNTKKDDFEKLFGKEKTAKLLDIFGHDGSVGKKLLQDNTGLKSVISKIGSRPLLSYILGDIVGGTKGAIAAAAAGLASQKVSGEKIARIKKLLMNAAANDETALAILKQPVKGTNYEESLVKLSTILGQQFIEEETPPTNNKPRKEQQISPQSLEDSIIPPPSTQPEPTPEQVAFSGFEPVLDAIRTVESGGNPRAVSPKGAMGAYQFMPATAKAYGLQDPFDEFASREAASSLIQDELDALGSLPLALAAYNAGRPAVLRAIQKAGTNDFNQVAKYLPAETVSYVPKVMSQLTG